MFQETILRVGLGVGFPGDVLVAGGWEGDGGGLMSLWERVLYLLSFRRCREALEAVFCRVRSRLPLDREQGARPARFKRILNVRRAIFRL